MSGFKNFIMRGNLIELYYAMVLPASRLLKLLERNKTATTRDCPECTMSIPIAATRCPECTAQITPGTEQPQPAGQFR
jgi:large conductance mechanosensitive channel